MSYAYWRHTKSGDVFAVETDAQHKVIAACGALHYKQVTQDNLDNPEFNWHTEDAEWFEMEKDNWRLVEPTEYYQPD
jgi:hypothetical protein